MRLRWAQPDPQKFRRHDFIRVGAQGAHRSTDELVERHSAGFFRAVQEICPHPKRNYFKRIISSTQTEVSLSLNLPVAEAAHHAAAGYPLLRSSSRNRTRETGSQSRRHSMKGPAPT